MSRPVLFVAKPSEAYIRTVEALRVLQKREGTARRAFAEAVARDIEEAFRRTYRLRPSGNHPCVFALHRRRCPGQDDGGAYRCVPPAADHAKLWTRDGVPVLITLQPYSLGWESLQALVEFCEAYGLEMNIDAMSSWHFPSWTLLVALATPKGWDLLHEGLGVSERATYQYLRTIGY